MKLEIGVLQKARHPSAGLVQSSERMCKRINLVCNIKSESGSASFERITESPIMKFCALLLTPDSLLFY